MSPIRAAATLAEAYDLGLSYMRHKRLSPVAPQPLPTRYWAEGNLEFLEEYRTWLSEGGISEMVIRLYHVKMASHVFALTLKPHHELDPDQDLECAMEYIRAKKLSVSWTKICENSLAQFRRFLRLKRGLGEESKITSFDVPRHTQGLPAWLVNELERYQRLLQRNWRKARLDLNIRGFWDKHGRMWRFLCLERGAKKLADLKRQLVLDYVDMRLAEGRTARCVNGELRYLRSFLFFLQDEGYTVPQVLLRLPGLKEADPLPKFLTDEQTKKLREEIEQNVQEETVPSRRRLKLLIRAAFYLLWQGGMRLGEVEELRLEDLDFPQKRLSVRDGKGRKDRTVYLTETAILALQEYLAVRGVGSGDHVFLYRNAPLKKDVLRANLQYAGERVGVKVYPHRLRHTCATQLLNAGCRVTSIQRFLGHKKLSSTMIYARAHDQTVAEDYFAAMQRVEERLEILPEPRQNSVDEVVKVLEPTILFQLIEQLEMPELYLEERLALASQLRKLLVEAKEYAPPENYLLQQL